MTQNRTHQGTHIIVDYIGVATDSPNETAELLVEALRAALDLEPATVLGQLCEVFDGTNSPPGFASVANLDESHASLHHYADQGLLALDCFTCGTSDPERVVQRFEQTLYEHFPQAHALSRQTIARFPQPPNSSGE